jgi:SAM-dependent methyltransferase
MYGAEAALNYRLAYRLGFHPWEDARKQPRFVETVSALLAEEEQGRQPPYGSALDVGTGSGIWGIELAKRGWQVTGVDNVPQALERAAARASTAGVELQLVEGDVTALRAAGLQPGFRLVLDTGTFHGLTSAQREAMAHEVSAITEPDAVVFLLVWPKRRRPLIRGASPTEITEAFRGWTITDVGPSHFHAPKPVELLLRPDEHWYRLRRQ